MQIADLSRVKRDLANIEQFQTQLFEGFLGFWRLFYISCRVEHVDLFVASSETKLPSWRAAHNSHPKSPWVVVCVSRKQEECFQVLVLQERFESNERR